MSKKKIEKPSILVPVDFSPCSQAAFDLAVELAVALDAPLVVLHVVHDPGEAPGYYRVKGRNKHMRRIEDVAREMLAEFVDEAKDRHHHKQALKKAEQMLVVGLPVTRTLEVIEQIAPRMMVMGSAGRTGISRFLLGSKAEQLVRLCPVPVVIVKNPEER